MDRAERNRAGRFFAGACAVLVGGVATAAATFPGGFDWVYMVISKLGSRTHNPVGGLVLSASLLAAVCLLWPVAGVLGRCGGAGQRPVLATAALRVGLVGGGLLALEGLIGLDLTRIGRKGHELVALFTFLGLYGGVLGLYLHRIRRSGAFVLPALVVVLPLCAVAATQGALYFGQRDLGWVDTAWREMGVPFWLSFAFWQWMAVVFLVTGLGWLLLFREAAARPRVAEAADAVVT
jgi:hypothetical protein